MLIEVDSKRSRGPWFLHVVRNRCIRFDQAFRLERLMFDINEEQ